MVRLAFVHGTVELRGVVPDAVLPPECTWDPRTRCYRAPAVAYAAVVRALVGARMPYEDEARGYEELSLGPLDAPEPRPYQHAALEAWAGAQHRGVVVLPTGAGKTLVAVRALEDRRRSTLVIAPTLDLVRQWFDVLREALGQPVGIIGGGDYDVKPITVSTYDSAWMHMEHLGRRFGLVVFDECHHLPAESYAFAARACLAPFRLGLTATPERTDGRDAVLDELIGPIVYARDIVELSGDWLAQYETRRVPVQLSDQEQAEYQSARSVYLAYVRGQGIRLGSPAAWSQFVKRAAMSEAGRRAMKAYRTQRAIAVAAPAKLDHLERLLYQHRRDRVLIFTLDNATAYQISRRFLIPAITHQTKVSERSLTLRRFSEAQYNAVVTSRVLNEGVDVPDANVAVVISGTGSVREHVQRLGRILRPQKNKRAVLYELVTEGTSEGGTSERRRDHVAYR